MRRLSLLLLIVLALTGCVRLPSSGPVVEATDVGGSGQRVDCCYLPNPPRVGETTSQIAAHFLEAMTATPLQTTVAQQFLTARAREQWRPERSTLIYGSVAIRGQRQVSITLRDVYEVDEHGTYRRTDRSRSLVFGMERESGEWRISGVPDALIVPATWASDNIETANAYFVDPTSRVLVPEPIHVPRGDGFATALMESLLAGPGRRREGVMQSFLPANLSLGLSVPVDADGTAMVELEGDASGISADQAELMATQIAWTLRQDTTIRRIKLTADGRTLPGQPTEISLQTGDQLDPAAFGASTRLWGIRQGRVVSGTVTMLDPVVGKLGRSDFGLRSLAVSLRGTEIAGVSGDGTAVLRGPVGAGQVDEVVSAASDLLPPAWDVQGRLWLLDRTPVGTQVSVILDSDQAPLPVPGLLPGRVANFVVSRDGTRLVGLVRGERRDRLVSYRIETRVNGAPRLVTPVALGTGASPRLRRIRDIAWRPPTTLAGLAPPGKVAQLRTLNIDGSPSGLQSWPTLAKEFANLAGAPDPDTEFLATYPGYVTLPYASSRQLVAVDVDASSLTYVG